MEALSGEHADEYHMAMDHYFQSLMINNKWEIVSSNSIADHNVLPETCYFKCKRNPDWTIRIFKARYCVRGDIQKRLFPEPLNSYFLVVQWATARLMFILQCILVFKSQSIDFMNKFSKSDSPSREPVFI